MLSGFYRISDENLYHYSLPYIQLKRFWSNSLTFSLNSNSQQGQESFWLATRLATTELISLQQSCRSRFCLSSCLFGCLKCLLLLIFRHILEIINDHPSLVGKVAKSFCKNTKYCRAKSKFRYFLSVEFVINQSTINPKSGQSVLAIHDSPPYCWDQWGWRHDIPLLLPITSNDHWSENR